MNDLYSLLRTQEYSGRGIIIGTTPSGKAAVGYFIMGRSASSRARRFERNGDELAIKYTAEKDPEHAELIIYSPIRLIGNRLIVTNGDQTDTVYEALRLGGSFESALATRAFEPDPPHFTARISGMVTFDSGRPTFELSVLKAGDPEGRTCVRNFFRYEEQRGVGHFIHTYMGGREVLKTFSGEPWEVNVPDDIDEFTETVWNGINEDNKVALYTRFIDPATMEYTDRLINKYE
ncbi:MAG: inosine monophosphate cyclohydrolase [Clostridia bacterium]|nr:inosine monophosphate cyclohydrolase [Clostridia bacterium]